MTNRITITIEVPDGVVPDVQYVAAAPRISDQEERFLSGGAGEQPPHPQSAPQAPQTPAAPAQVYSGEWWPAGDCPKHHRPWKSGNYGLFCSAKDPDTQKGYCELKPGDIWNGKRLA